jgi:hypothetical protein
MPGVPMSNAQSGRVNEVESKFKLVEIDPFELY